MELSLMQLSRPKYHQVLFPALLLMLAAMAFGFFLARLRQLTLCLGGSDRLHCFGMQRFEHRLETRPELLCSWGLSLRWAIAQWL